MTTTPTIPPPSPDGWALWIETLIGGRTPVAWFDNEFEAKTNAFWINSLGNDTEASPADTWQWVEVRPMPRTAAADMHGIAEMRDKVTA